MSEKEKYGWRYGVKTETTDFATLLETFNFSQEDLHDAFKKPFRAIPDTFGQMLTMAKGSTDLMNNVLEKYTMKEMTPHMMSAFIIRAASFCQKKSPSRPRSKSASH